MLDIATILGVLFALEGALCAGMPGLVKRAAAEVAGTDEALLRKGGLVALVAGVGIVWLLRA